MRPAYDSIYFDLKDAIDSGLYGYKDYLPSESVLVKRYRCAHNTVRKALEILARDGYVQPIHGKGVRVICRPQKPVAKAGRTYELKDIESFRQSVTRQGFEATTKVLSMETMVADEDFANLTGFDEGEKIVHLERVRFVDGKPLVRESDYFRGDIVQGMTKADAEYSIYHYIEDVRNEKIVTSKRKVTVEHVNDRDVELLELDGADYLAVVVCETFDGAGLLCEASMVRHVPHMFLLRQTAIRTIVSQRLDA